jgi:hypothetical protein
MLRAFRVPQSRILLSLWNAKQAVNHLFIRHSEKNTERSLLADSPLGRGDWIKSEKGS